MLMPSSRLKRTVLKTTINKFLMTTLLMMAISLSTGCATTVGFGTGFLTGGASLTKTLYDSNNSDTVKYSATVPAFIAGTIVGPFANIPKGVELDQRLTFRIRDLLDPFDAGFFKYQGGGN